MKNITGATYFVFESLPARRAISCNFHLPQHRTEWLRGPERAERVEWAGGAIFDERPCGEKIDEPGQTSWGENLTFI